MNGNTHWLTFLCCLILPSLLIAQPKPLPSKETKDSIIIQSSGQVHIPDTGFFRLQPDFKTAPDLKLLPIDSLRNKLQLKQKPKSRDQLLLPGIPDGPNGSGPPPLVWIIGCCLLLFPRFRFLGKIPKASLRLSVAVAALLLLALPSSVQAQSTPYQGIFVGVADSTDAEFIGLFETLSDFADNYKLIDTSLNDGNILIRIFPPSQTMQIDQLLTDSLDPNGISLVRSFGAGADIVRDSFVNNRQPASPFVDVVEINFPIFSAPIQIDTTADSDSIGLVVVRGNVSVGSGNTFTLFGNNALSGNDILSGNLSDNNILSGNTGQIGLLNNNVGQIDFNLNVDFNINDIFGVGQASENTADIIQGANGLYDRVSGLFGSAWDYLTGSSSSNNVNTSSLGGGLINFQNYGSSSPTLDGLNASNSPLMQTQLYETLFPNSSVDPFGGLIEGYNSDVFTLHGNVSAYDYSPTLSGALDLNFSDYTLSGDYGGGSLPFTPAPFDLTLPPNQGGNTFNIYDPSSVLIQQGPMSYPSQPPGGVEFSEITFTGFNIDSLTGSPVFISEANEVAPGNGINVDSLSDRFMQYFVEALILRPENLFVSLDVINQQGRSRTTPPMEQTYIVREMLDHDIYMKLDYLATALFGHGSTSPTDAGITADWLDLFEASPYYLDYVALNFGRLPYIQARAVIIGDTVKIYQQGEKLYLEEAPLTLDYELENLGLDRSGYNFTPEQTADLDTMLSQYSNTIQHRMDTAATRFIAQINSTDRYSELRAVYRAIAMANLYKEINVPNNPYSNLINSDDFSNGLAHPDTFPRIFYDSMAYTLLTSEAFTNPGGQVQLREVWGGVEMMDLEENDSLGLTINQQTIYAGIDSGYVQQNGNYYLNQGQLGSLNPELAASNFYIRPADTTVLNMTVDEPININVRLFNTGLCPARNFTVKFFDEFKGADGQYQSYYIGEMLIDSVEYHDSKAIQFTWNPFAIGFHKIRVVVDSDENIVEVNEDNNTLVGYCSVLDKQPLVGYYNLNNGFFIPDSNATIFFLAYDHKEGIPETVEIISDQDGILMNQNDSLAFTLPSLSLGQHELKLRATNDRGIQDSVVVRVDVVSYNKPIAEIIKPLDNQALFSQVPYEFEAFNFDFRDSVLCYDSTAFWIIGTDTIGYNCTTNYSFDAIGNQEVIFSVVNSAGFESRDTVMVTILDGNSALDTLNQFPSGDTSFLAICNELMGCDTSFTIELPYNARVIEGTMSVEGEYVLLEPENKTGDGDFGTSAVNSVFNGPVTNTSRGNYTYNRATSCMDINFAAGPPYAPVNEKDVFRLGEFPRVATYLTNVNVAVDLEWIITYPDGIQTTVNFTTPAPPSGQFFPIYPVRFTINNVIGNNRQGAYSVEVFSKESGAATYNSEQTIYFTYDYLKSDTTFDSAMPLEPSHTFATNVQSSSPYNPVNPASDTIQNTENRLYSYLTIADAADSMHIKWSWYEPSGLLYKEEIVQAQPSPAQHSWYDWVKAWSYLDINGANAGSIPGDWTVDIRVRYFFQSGGITISSFPRIVRDTFTIEGIGNISYPEDPTVYIENDSLTVWDHFGSFQDSTTINIAGGLNAYLEAYTGSDTLIAIPIHITSEEPGELVSDSLYIKYALLDVEPPLIDSNLVTTASPVVSGQNFNVEIIISDNDSVSLVLLAYSGTSYTLSRVGSSNTFAVSGIPAGLSGNYPVLLEAYDCAGNRSEWLTNLVVENPLASLTLVATANPASWSTNTNFQISWTDLGASVVEYFMKIGQGAYQSVGGNTSTNINHQIDGSTMVTIYGVDAIGNASPIGSTEIYLDKTAPNQLFFQPLAGAGNWQNDTSYLINWTDPGDVGGGIIDYEMQIEGNASSIGDTTSYLFTSTQSGSYHLSARAKDVVGQQAIWSDSLLIKVDLTDPLMTILSSASHPDTSKWYTNNQPQFAFQSSDAHSGIAGHRYLFTNIPNSQPNSTSFYIQEDSLDVSLLPVANENQGVTEGIWYLHLLPVDQVGNKGPISRYPIKIDLTPPNTVLVDSVANDTIIAPYTINFTANDILSGVDSTYLRLGNGQWISADAITVDTAGTFWLYYYSTDVAGNTEDLDSTLITVLPRRAFARAKVFFEGPFDSTAVLMRDDLRSNDLLPLSEPFTALGFHHPIGGEVIDSSVLDVTGNNAIVDWVLLEVRSDTNAALVLATRAALLQRDGDIVDTNGVSAVVFANLPKGNYYLAVRHRNHLGVRSANLVNLDPEQNVLVDFSDPVFTTFGTNAMKLINGVNCMYGGNANQDAQINAVDNNLYWNPQNGQPYNYLNSSADFNLDGAVNAVDVNLYWNPNNSVIEQLD